MMEWLFAMVCVICVTAIIITAIVHGPQITNDKDPN